MRENFITSYQKGNAVTDFFLLKDVQVKEAKNGKPFGVFVIADKEGTLDCKKWDLTDKDLELLKRLTAGDIVKVKGTVDVYNDAMQLIIDKIRLAEDGDEFEVDDIVKTAPMDAEKMFHVLKDKVIESIKDPDYREICKLLYEENRERIMYWPAAKMVHHAHMAGYLWHTYRMTRTAVKLADIYPSLNRSLLLAGTILHDIGKLYELSSNQYGIVSEYTAKGNLLGHLVMGCMMVEEAAKQTDMPEEKKLLLEHMLASHHGTDPAMGSAHRPCIPEAFILHEIDMIDMYAYIGEDQLPNAEPGTMTSSIFGLGGKLYKPFLVDEEVK